MGEKCTPADARGPPPASKVRSFEGTPSRGPYSTREAFDYSNSGETNRRTEKIAETLNEDAGQAEAVGFTKTRPRRAETTT